MHKQENSLDWHHGQHRQDGLKGMFLSSTVLCSMFENKGLISYIWLGNLRTYYELFKRFLKSAVCAKFYNEHYSRTDLQFGITILYKEFSQYILSEFSPIATFFTDVSRREFNANQPLDLPWNTWILCTVCGCAEMSSYGRIPWLGLLENISHRSCT